MMAGEVVLVVDEPASLDRARSALEAEGYQVQTAARAAEVMPVVREHRPALILMGLQPRDDDGLELTRRLKADPSTRDIVIVAVTDGAMKSDREKVMAAGSDGYITKPIDPVRFPVVVAAHLARRSLPSVATVSAPQRPSILLVEDNSATRRMLRVTLETSGYVVREAADGTTALALAAVQTPDLILQDFLLPDMDGRELARRLRDRPLTAAVPIVCISGFLAHVGDDAEFAAVLEKPVDPLRLLEILHWALRPFVAAGHLPGKGLSVIVVDDDAMQRRLTEAILVNAGFDVRAYGNAAGALNEARRARPSVIVSDALMPGMDGFELCVSVRCDPELASVPVVLTSSLYSDEADQELALKVGASKLVPRISNRDDIVPAVLSSLSCAPPSLAELSLEPVLAEHAQRAIWQLERQVKRRAELAQRCALMETQLSILAGVADALTSNRVLDGALEDVLGACLDMAGISKGALFRTSNGKMALAHQIGFSGAEVPALAALFDEEKALEEVAQSRKALAVPSAAVSAAAARTILARCGVTSALVVPIVSGERFFGAVFLGGRGVEMTDDEHVAFARVLAAQLGQALALAEAFERVATSEENLRTVVSSMQDIVVTLDRSQRATAVYGRSDNPQLRAADIVGKRIEEALGGQADPVHAEANRKALAGESVVYEWTYGADRSPTYMQTAASPLRGSSGEVVGVVRVGRDVTKMKALQEQLILSDRVASVGLLAASVAHEINNPLAVAVANLQLAKESLARNAGSNEADDLRTEIADASEAVNRVCGIVRDLRIFCRPDSDEPTHVELVAVLESSLRLAINEIRPRARVRKSYGPAPTVYANEGRLGQVFLNLIVNAAQAMDKGNAAHNELRVAIGETAGGRAVVEIADTGPGIPPELIPKLFSPFFTTKALGAGTGLGLTICHRIVTELGGTIEVESQTGRGALFRVILPGSNVPPRTERPPPAPSSASRRGRILVIDDDEMIAATLTRLLSPLHEVTAISDAREALSHIVRGERFDVILCDLMMPGMTGADFYRELSPLASEELDKIIFMSGGAFTSSSQAFLDQTANTWVQKPFDLSALLKLVNRRVG